MQYRDIDFEDLLKALKLAGSQRTNVDRADYAIALRELGELYREIDDNDISEAIIRLPPLPPPATTDIALTDVQDVLVFTGEIPTPPWESGGNLINYEIAVFQGTKYWDVHNASEEHSLQFHVTYDHYRYEVRAGEVWPYDSSSRSEVRDTVVRPNATPIWGAYSFLVEYPPNESAAEWVVLGQMHDQTLVNNPDFAFEIDENGEDLIIVWRDGGAALAITTVRSTPAWSADENGLYREFAPNKPRMEMNIGLLVEEQRINSVRNARCAGAVIGSPGTLPTNWNSGGAGLTRTVVGVGIQNGINYVEVRLQGGANSNIDMESASVIVAANGQTWTASTFVALVGGSLANISLLGLFILGNTAAGVFVEGSSISLAGATGILSRFSITKTFANASTVRTSPRLSITATGAFDITLRIGWPQLEQGAFVTSPIPTSPSSLDNTRAADVITTAEVSVGPLTLFAEFMVPAGIGSGAKAVVQLDEGVGNDRRLIRVDNTTGNIAAYNVAAGISTYNSALVSPAIARTVYKVAMGTEVDNFRSAANGVLSAVDTSGALPISSTTLRLGREVNSNSLNGYLRRITYWPFRLSDAQLQQISDPNFSDFFPEGATLDLRFERWGRYIAHRERLYRNLWYNIVFEYRADPTGVSSILAVWRNSEKVVDLAGPNVPLGMPDSTGHYWKMGVYRDPATDTDTLAVRYANTEVGSIDLSGRILNPLPLTRERPIIIPPLDGTAPSLCASFRQRLLSSFESVYYRLEEGSADQIDRLNDQSVNNWGSAIAGVGGTPTLVLTADVSTANFLGDDSFTNFADMEDLFAPNDFYFIVRFKCTSISTNEPDSWDNDTIMGDAGRWVGISFRQPNFVLFHLDDNIAPDAKFEIPFTLNTWTTAEMYFDGAAFYGRVNGGAWSSQAVGGPITDMTGGWRLGRGLTGKFFRGEISDFAVYPTRLTEPLRNQIRTAIAA